MRTARRTLRRLPLALAAVLAVAATVAAPSEAHAAPAGTCGVSPSSTSPVLALVSRPFADAADAETRLTCLENVFRARKDRRAVFATLYRMTTERVNAAIAAGDFEDGPWASRYLLAFANMYREALYAYEGRTSRVPEAWRIAFDSARSGKNLILQELLLGVNGHVNNDLSQALVRVDIGPRGSALRASRERDHLVVNDVLRAAVDDELAVIAALYAPAYGEFDPRLTDLLGNVFVVNLVQWRAHAWDNAVRLSDARDPISRGIVRFFIETEAAAGARLILVPRMTPGLFQALKALEGDVWR